MMDISELEGKKAPHGEVTLVGAGRLGLRTALNLMQIHRGGPERINVIDGQRVSADDIIFRLMGARLGEYKVKFIESLAAPGFSRTVRGIPEYVDQDNLHLLGGDVVCVEIAGGDTLPVTAEIIRYAQRRGASTISTMGVFGIGEEDVKVLRIDEADPGNPIVEYLLDEGITDHILVGTGKLIRDWEPVTPYVLDRVSEVMTAEILKLLRGKLE
jgi:predicted ThiF/HesA family dinucleotide-utilizing enzyme